MEPPLITVLIDTFNYGHFIEQAIDSVLSQDFPMEKVEILIADDGSTDDTAERVKKYGSRIQYLYKPNGGQASAFNMGLAHAKGEIVLLLDADDYFLPGKLPRVVHEFDKRPHVGLVYHTLLLSEPDSSELRELPTTLVSGFLPDEKAKLLGFEPYPTSCLAFRRQVLNQLLPIPESLRLQADAYPTLLIVLVAPILALPDPLAVYRIHGRNLCFMDYLSPTKEAALRRINSNTSVMRAVRGWIIMNMDRLRQNEARLFLRHRLLSLEEQRFSVEHPGRLRFFWFLIRWNYAHTSVQTWKFTAVNYTIAFASLIFGYQGARRIYDWRSGTILSFRSLFKRRYSGEKHL